MVTPTVQQVLAENDGLKAGDLLFTLLAETAQGREMSSVVAEIAQGVVSNGRWSANIKRLAYDLCKAVPLSDADTQYILTGIRLDINSGDPDLAVLALRMLPHVPPHLLSHLLSIGELSRLCDPALSSAWTSVRAAAVLALGAVLLIPDVLRTAAASAGMANQTNEHWMCVTDALLDEEEDIVAAAVHVTCQLLQQGLAADVRTSEGFLLERLATIAAARVSAALGPVTHAFQGLSLQARVDALAMLAALTEHAALSALWRPADVGGAAGLPNGTILPGLGELAPAVWAVASEALHTGDPPVRLEAARTAMRVAALVAAPGSLSAASVAAGKVRQPGATRLTADDGPGPAGGPGGVAQPTGLLLEAAAVLLEQDGALPLSEAASDDLLGVVLVGLPALPRNLRPLVLVQLWSRIARVRSSPARVALCARAWDAVIQDEDAQPLPPLGATMPPPSLLGAALSDRHVAAVLAGRTSTGLPGSPERGAGNVAQMISQLTDELKRGAQHAAAYASAGADAVKQVSSAAATTATAAATTATAAATIAASTAASTATAVTGMATAAVKENKSRFFSSIMRGKDKDKEPKDPKETKKASLPPPPPVPSGPVVTDLGNATGTLRTVSTKAAPANPLQGIDLQGNMERTSPGLATYATASDRGGDQAPAVPPTLGSHRHELAATLLLALHVRHPVAPLASQLCADVAAMVGKDVAPGPALTTKYTAWQQQRVLGWVHAVRSALQATAVCMQWEPYVVPAVTAQVNAAHTSRPPADFSSTVQDAWLQLLQAAATTARALQLLNKPAVAVLGPGLGPSASVLPAAVAQALPSGVGSGITAMQSDTAGYGAAQVPESPRTPGGAMPSSSASMVSTGGMTASPLSQAVWAEVKELTNVMKQVFRDWGSVSRALRPRALWVLAHCLDLAPHADEQWEQGLRALHDVLCRQTGSGNAARVSDLLGSAAQGVLLQSGRMGWARERAFVFDVVAASALCEKPDYDALGLVVALTAAQAWATRLQDALATCPVETSKRVMHDVVFQSGRLDTVLREFLGTSDASGSPILREWAKRIIRSLAATVVFEHPSVRALEEQEAAEKAAREAAEKAAAHEGGNGYDDGVINSSSSSSEAGDVGNLLPVSLPTNMYLPLGGGGVRPALPPSNTFSGQRQHQLAGLGPEMLSGGGFAAGQVVTFANSTTFGTHTRESTAEPFKARALALHGNVPAHMVASGSGAHPWGYPFSSAPRASCLFYSKRARRARLLQMHLRQAASLALLGGGAGSMAAGLAAGAQQYKPVGSQGLADTPALSEHSTLRLDHPTFWAMLPSTVAGPAPSADPRGGGGISLVEQQELGGPGDPILLVGCIARSATDAAQLQLRITVINRSEVEVKGSLVQVVALGPVQLDRRAINWLVPRLSPTDRVTHTFSLKLLGYGLVRLSVRLQLLHSGSGASQTIPVLLPCRPLHVGLVQHLLHAPLGALPPTPREFYSTWSTLPARAELPAACVWPGREGATAALSAMLRSPLVCVTLHHVNVTSSYQIALAGETATGDEVLIIAHTQLVPPPPSLSAAGTAGRDPDLDAAAAASSTWANGNGAGKSGGKNATAKDQQQAVAAAMVDASRQPHALLHVSVRSALPEVALAVQVNAAEFLADLCGGAAQPLGAHLAAPAVGGSGAHPTRPPLHPRVAALDVAHAQSLRAMSVATAALLGGVGGHGGASALTTGLDVYAQGVKARSKVSHRFMEAAAMAEWQRLVGQPL